MFELRIILTLALVCLQVSGPSVTNYLKLFSCFTARKGPFQDFFPFHIAKFPFAFSKFSGEYQNVDVFGLDNVDIVAKESLSNSEVIEFKHTFLSPVFSGSLTESNVSIQSVSALVTNLKLEGRVAYAKQKVTYLNMTETFDKILVLMPYQSIREDITIYANEGWKTYKKDIEDIILDKLNKGLSNPEEIEAMFRACDIKV